MKSKWKMFIFIFEIMFPSLLFIDGQRLHISLLLQSAHWSLWNRHLVPNSPTSNIFFLACFLLTLVFADTSLQPYKHTTDKLFGRLSCADLLCDWRGHCWLHLTSLFLSENHSSNCYTWSINEIALNLNILPTTDLSVHCYVSSSQCLLWCFFGYIFLWGMWRGEGVGGVSVCSFVTSWKSVLYGFKFLSPVLTS